MTGISLVEDRVGPRQYQGRSSGVSFPILPGVRYRTGRSRGRSIPGTPRPVAIDAGTVYITNKRFIFRGAKQTRECLYDKMLGLERNDRHGITVISVSNRQKPTTIQYGRKIAPWFNAQMDLALAHYNGKIGELAARLRQNIAQLESSRPVPPKASPRLDGPTQRATIDAAPPPPPSFMPATTALLDPPPPPPPSSLLPPTAGLDGKGMQRFAAELAMGLQSLSTAYHEYATRAAWQSGPLVSDPKTFALGQLDEITFALKKIEPLSDPKLHEKAFGPNGTTGDDVAAAHHASVIVEMYASLILTGNRLKAANVGAEWSPVCQAIARLVDAPLHQVQVFSTDVTHRVEEFFQAVRSGQTTGRTLTVKLKLDLDPIAMESFHAALATVRPTV